MFKSVYDVSRADHPGYKQYEHLLSGGWIPGRKLDDSDSQYSGFRENIPVMLLVLILHPILRRITESLTYSKSTKTKTDPDARLASRVTFDLTFAIVFLLALHGFSIFKVLIILYLNFQIATALPKKHAGVATWVFNIGILFANELCHGYQLRDISALIFNTSPDPASLAATIDGYGGLLPRWEILFNITVLRLIAFNFDYIWMQDRRASSPIEVHHPFLIHAQKLIEDPPEEKPQPLFTSRT